MAQLTSTNVKVFPSAYRGQGIDPEARLNSERNLTAALNALTDADAGFVIDYNSTSKVCTFILGGYWFEANLTGQTLTGSVYAHIKVGDRGTASDDWNCKSLLSFGSTPKGELDANNNFTGLVIDANATYEGATHNLLLLQNGSVPAASKLKIKSSSIADGDVKEPISEHLTAQNIYSDNVQVDTKIIAEEGQFVTGINCEGYANLDEGFTACWDGQGRYLAELNSNGIFYAQGIDLTEDGAPGHIYAYDLYLDNSAIYFDREARPTLTKTNSNVVIACRHLSQSSRDVELTLSDDSGIPTYRFSDNAVLLSANSASIGSPGTSWSAAYVSNITSTTLKTKTLNFGTNGTISGTATITGTLKGDINGHVNTESKWTGAQTSITLDGGHNYIINVTLTAADSINIFGATGGGVSFGSVYLPTGTGLTSNIWVTNTNIPNNQGDTIDGFGIKAAYSSSTGKWTVTFSKILNSGAWSITYGNWLVQDLGQVIQS